MFCFDIETLGVESTSVIASAAIVHFEPTINYSYQELLDNTLFVKFNIPDQIKRLKRTVDQPIMDWWAKRSEFIRNANLTPHSDDYLAEDGIDRLQAYIDKYPKGREQIFWARGTLDQVCIDSLCNKVDKNTISEFYTWRDIRTAIDIIYGTTNGYCEVADLNFNKNLVIKHLPYHDICLDVKMLINGKEKE
jgi:hypothetical protein